MKNITFLIFALTILSGCYKEDELTPTKIQDWYTIYPGENMDEVDQKIYDIYVKHNIAIFYQDTIGSEDRGRVDSLGNTLYYYEVLDINYNISTNTNNEFYRYYYPTLIDKSDSEEKKKLLPMLDFLDEHLLPILKGVDIYIPAILLCEELYSDIVKATDRKDHYVYRGFNFITIAYNGLDKNISQKEYALEFILQCYTKGVSELMDYFYDYQKQELKKFDHLPLNVQLVPNNQIYATSYEDNYITAFNSVQEIKNIQASIEKYKLEIENCEKTINDENSSLADIVLAQMMLSAYQQSLKTEEEKLASINIDETYENLESIRCMKYGFLHLTTEETSAGLTKSQEGDLQDFMKAIFFMEESEFLTLYDRWEIVKFRYQILKLTLKDIGFDIENIISIMKRLN